MKSLIFACIFPFLAVADIPSNTVPTHEIMATFQVIQYPAGSFDAMAFANLTQIKITDPFVGFLLIKTGAQCHYKRRWKPILGAP